MIVIFLEFHSTEQGLPLVDSWSRGLGARWQTRRHAKLDKFVFGNPHDISSPDVSLDFVSGNIRTLGKTKLTVSLGI